MSLYPKTHHVYLPFDHDGCSTCKVKIPLRPEVAEIHNVLWHDTYGMCFVLLWPEGTLSMYPVGQEIAVILRETETRVYFKGE